MKKSFMDLTNRFKFLVISSFTMVMFSGILAVLVWSDSFSPYCFASIETLDQSPNWIQTWNCVIPTNIEMAVKDKGVVRKHALPYHLLLTFY